MQYDTHAPKELKLFPKKIILYMTNSFQEHIQQITRKAKIKYLKKLDRLKLY